MRKGLVALLLSCLFLWPALGVARVVLPEGRVLAGPADELVSEFRDEFNFFPSFMLPAALSPRMGLNGWIRVDFQNPAGDRVNFTLSYDVIGNPIFLSWGGGQEYFFSGNRFLPRSTLTNRGTLNLETGEVEVFLFNASLFNTTTNPDLSKVNRIALRLGLLNPPPSNYDIPLQPLPPGYLFREVEFTYDEQNRITGFSFIGQSATPLGWWAENNESLGIFPPFSLGPNNELYFPNPDFCREGTPEEDCPTSENNRDGILTPRPMFLHPYLSLQTRELREIASSRQIPPCATPDLPADGVLVSAAGKLYHLGGVADGEVSGRVEIFDPETNSWQTGPPMLFATAEAQAAVIGDEIYVVGGRRFPRSPANARLQIFDTTSGRWRVGASAPTPVARASAAAAGGWLFVVSGRTNRPNGSPTGNLRFTDQVQVYDPATDAWSQYPARLGDQGIYLERPSAVGVGSRIYLAGGLSRDDQLSDQLLVLDTFTGRFSVGPAANWGFYDAAAGLLGNRLVVTGGRRQAKGPGTADMQVLEIDRGAWLYAVQQPLATAASGAAVLNGQVYVVGGRTPEEAVPFPGTPSAAVQAFDVARGWALCRSQPLFAAADVLNTASLVVGSRALSPGTQATILGSNLASRSASAPADDPFVPTELEGVSVTVDGLPAPILAIAPERIDFQIPYGVTVEEGSVELVLQRQGATQQANPVQIPIAAVSPGIFIHSCGSARERRFLDEASAIACQEDGTLNYAANAVPPGDVAVVQMTGLGAIDTPLANGERAPDPSPSAIRLPTVTIRGGDGQSYDATVLSATLAAGELGIFDVRVVVPPQSRIGNRVLIEATVDGVPSNRATLSIGDPMTTDPLPCTREYEPLIRGCLN